MAAINETKGQGVMNIKLTSSEYPELSVEGKQGQRVNLRKKLNKMIREKRRISGGPMGKSPSKEITKDTKLGAKKEQYPASTMPSPVEKKKEKGYEGRKSDLEFISKTKKKKVKKDKTKSIKEDKTEDIKTSSIGARGAEPKAYQKKKKLKKKDSKTTTPPKELTAAQRAKRGLGPKKEIKAKMKGYGPDSGEQSWSDIIKEGWQELWRDKQPTGEESTGVKDVPVKERYETPDQALTPDPEAEKLEEEYEQRFLSDKALRDQFDTSKREIPKVVQKHIDDPTKLIGGQKPAWWPEGKEEMGEGVISDEDFANQKILDAQIKDKLGDKRKSKELDTSSLSDERNENIQKLFEAKDPEAELIASEYEAQAAIKDAEDRRKLASKKAEEQRIVGPKPAKSPDVAQDEFSPQSEYEAKHGPGSFKKTEEKIQKIQYIRDHHPDMPKKDRYENIEKEIDQIPDKETTAEVREADPDWYIDPYTGFAIDLNKLQARQDRKDAMEMASLLPADKRTMFLYQEGLISKNDVDKLLEPSEQEKLEKQLKTMQIAVQASNLLLNNKKLQNYQSPEQKEWHTSYRNAVTNDDYDGIYTFGRKLGLSEAELEKIVEGHKKANVAKATKSDTDIFKKRFNIPYTKVWDARQKVMMESAKVFEEGEAGGMMNFMGQKYSGRKGLLADNGLLELNDANALSANDLANYFAELPDATIFDERRWQKEDCSPDYPKLLNDPLAYQRLLQKNLIYRHMETLTGGQYKKMEQYKAQIQSRDENLNSILVSN